MIALLIVACLGADPELPLVVEHYDAIVVVEETSAAWNRSRLHFLRGGQVIAERAGSDEMLWTMSDGRLAVAWEDYGVCRRIVTCDEMAFGSVEERAPTPADANPWWWQGRRMTDLKQP